MTRDKKRVYAPYSNLDVDQLFNSTYNLEISMYELDDNTQFDIVLAKYNYILMLNPQHINTLYRVGNILYYQKNDYLGTVECYNKVLALDANNIEGHHLDIYFDMGKIYSEQREYDNSLICFEKALLLDDNGQKYHSDIFFEMAELYYFKKQHVTSLKYYNKVLELDSECQVAHNMIAKIRSERISPEAIKEQQEQNIKYKSI